MESAVSDEGVVFQGGQLRVFLELIEWATGLNDQLQPLGYSLVVLASQCPELAIPNSMRYLMILGDFATRSRLADRNRCSSP